MKRVALMAALGVFFVASNAVALTVSMNRKTDEMLMKAIENSDEQAAQQAINNGANINSFVDLGSRGLRKFLLTIPDNKNIKQVTFLQYAVLMQASIGLIKILINAGADVNMQAAGSCWSALSLAMILYPQAAQVLKDNGADIVICPQEKITIMD
jgi:ankyrin repeat protein